MFSLFFYFFLFFSASSPQKTPPPQRQGVIQRHSKPPSPIKNRIPFPQTSYLPGHEAFSSLVDVASNQPHISVPHAKDDKRAHQMAPLEQANATVQDELRYQMSLQQMQQRQFQHVISMRFLGQNINTFINLFYS